MNNYNVYNNYDSDNDNFNFCVCGDDGQIFTGLTAAYVQAEYFKTERAAQQYADRLNMLDKREQFANQVWQAMERQLDNAEYLLARELIDTLNDIINPLK
jgi:hypothetical protein